MRAKSLISIGKVGIFEVQVTDSGIIFVLLFAMLMIPLQLGLISAGLLVAASVAGLAGLIATVLVALSQTDLFNPNIFGLFRLVVISTLFVTLPFSAGAATIAATIAIVMAAAGAIAALIFTKGPVDENEEYMAYLFRKNGHPGREIS